ncbi:hypothetical protein Hanom_Chr09g00785981 [Helianthus anomalus]
MKLEAGSKLAKKPKHQGVKWLFLKVWSKTVKVTKPQGAKRKFTQLQIMSGLRFFQVFVSSGLYFILCSRFKEINLMSGFKMIPDLQTLGFSVSSFIGLPSLLLNQFSSGCIRVLNLRV